MKRWGTTRGHLARALAERSSATGKHLTEGQAQDELDRVFHGIVTSLRRGRPVEMPGVGTMTAQVPETDERGPSSKLSRRKPSAVANTGRDQ